MLPTVEKVIILKTVNIFSEIPEEYLVELATNAEEVEVNKGDVVFEKGDFGSSMYIVINGKVRVHDGDKEIAILGDRNVFGELGALDPNPRVATVTAIENTTLFCIHEIHLYELLNEYSVVTHAIIKVLCQRARS